MPTLPSVAIDQLKLPPNASLTFTFDDMPSGVSKTLTIPYGANAIKWAYTLNTYVQPTYGGEVVQILSTYVGPMQISGNTGDFRGRMTSDDTSQEYTTGNDMLFKIYSWFRAYMTQAGLNNRNQHGVLFQYPARGWKFYIQPTQIPEYTYDVTKIGTEWQLTAEVVSDPDDVVLGQFTMGAFTKSIEQTDLIQVGFNPSDPQLNPAARQNTAINPGQFANNFQSLVAAWSTGNFDNWAFDALQPTTGNNLSAAEKYYLDFFGTDQLGVSSVGGTSTGSVPVYNGPPNPSTIQNIVQAIDAVFTQASVPGRLGVATAIVESNLNPDSRAPNDGGAGIDGVGLFSVHYGGRESTTQVQQASVTFRTAPPTQYYPSGQQIADAASWFARLNPFGTNFSPNDDNQMAQWAVTAQGPDNTNNVYTNKILAALKQADALISQDVTPTVTPAQAHLEATALSNAQQQIGYQSGANNNNQYGQQYGLNNEPWCAIFCSVMISAAGGKFHYAAVPQIWQDAKANKNGLSVVTAPTAGDLAIFDWSGPGQGVLVNPDLTHTGFFKSWVAPGSTFMTVEGNTSPNEGGPQYNAGVVAQKTRSIGNQFVGFVRYSQ